MTRLFILFILFLPTTFLSQSSVSSRRIDCYKPGQFVYFESSNKKIDTVQIWHVDSVRQYCTGRIKIPYRPLGNHFLIEFSQDSCYLNINDTTGNRVDFNQLKKITNTTIESNQFIFLNYKDFWPDIKTTQGEAFVTFLGPLHSDTLKINGKIITKYYVIKSYNFTNTKIPTYNTKHSHIEFFVWTDLEGLTAYKTKKGIWWTRKSSS